MNDSVHSPKDHFFRKTSTRGGPVHCTLTKSMKTIRRRLRVKYITNKRILAGGRCTNKFNFVMNRYAKYFFPFLLMHVRVRFCIRTHFVSIKIPDGPVLQCKIRINEHTKVFNCQRPLLKNYYDTRDLASMKRKKKVWRWLGEKKTKSRRRHRVKLGYDTGALRMNRNATRQVAQWDSVEIKWIRY